MLLNFLKLRNVMNFNYSHSVWRSFATIICLVQFVFHFVQSFVEANIFNIINKYISWTASTNQTRKLNLSCESINICDNVCLSVNVYVQQVSIHQEKGYMKFTIFFNLYEKNIIESKEYNAEYVQVLHTHFKLIFLQTS
jgi:hypothetical protein